MSLRQESILFHMRAKTRGTVMERGRNEPEEEKRGEVGTYLPFILNVF